MKPFDLVQDAAQRDDAIRVAIQRAQQNLLRLQNAEGWWAGELTVDSTLCSDYVLFMHWDGKVDPVLQEKCVAHIRRRQLPDGGWNIYQGGPSEINATVKAYFALKLAGHSSDAPWMREARASVLRLGGIPRMNTYAKLYLALLGQFPWKYLPTIPVELILLPDWLFFNVHEMSSWSRAMLMPLAIINHFKPVRQLPAERHLHELWPAGTEPSDLRPNAQLFSLKNLTFQFSMALRILDWLSWLPGRQFALKKAAAWMTERMSEGSDGLAAIFPAILNSIIALKALGTPDDDPLLQKAARDFEGLFVDDPEDFRIQPCLSPVWDTAICTVALAESGIDPSHAALKRAAQWLTSKEVRIRGDWVHKNPHPEASGWAFEFNNVFYPDTDDTAMVLMALRLVQPEWECGKWEGPQRPDGVGGSATSHDAAPGRGAEAAPTLKALFERALPWQISFQCRDGGWAAFDKDVTKRWLEDIPFADHNAMLDPACSDLTGRTLELLGYVGFDRQSPVVKRALEQLKATQEHDGSWYGRWGVNYIYGTWQVLRGLRAIGENMRQDWIVRARDWLESCQNEDGGWGETCASYDDPSLKGRGPSTASQTAWALMGLIACAQSPEELDRRRIRRGISHLVGTQNRDGSWTEPETTGTGFPKVFYLKYDMYRNNWPLLALATYANYKSGVFHRQSFYRV
jgi:squalene-hopene/tetraprenyl-beta-curcumene cyclase